MAGGGVEAGEAFAGAGAMGGGDLHGAGEVGFGGVFGGVPVADDGAAGEGVDEAGILAPEEALDEEDDEGEDLLGGGVVALGAGGVGELGEEREAEGGGTPGERWTMAAARVRRRVPSAARPSAMRRAPRAVRGAAAEESAGLADFSTSSRARR